MLGKACGYGALALAFALVLGLPLLLFAAPGAVAAWTASFAGELLMVAAAALFCALSLRSVVAALATVAGFYALGRTIDAILVMASASPESTDWRDVGARWIMQAISAIVPHVDRMTQSGWLSASIIDAHAAAGALAQAAVYTVLLLAASLFDFHRQSF